MTRRIINFGFLSILLSLFTLASKSYYAQLNVNDPASLPESQFESPESFLWIGNYGTFRVSEDFYVTGEFHYRRTQHEGTRYIGRMAQLYNRWGIQWNPSKKFQATWGAVLRFDFTPEPGNDDFSYLILEPRLWHEYLFAAPFSRFMIYHRLRFEHRWNTQHAPGSDWIYRNRFRYMFLMKIPLNNSKLIPGTFYLYPNVEIIMQNGKRVRNSALEDLRLFAAVGYIHNPRVSFSAGMMYTTGQRLQTNMFRTRWVARFNTYISLDFRKMKDKIPTVSIFD